MQFVIQTWDQIVSPVFPFRRSRNERSIDFSKLKYLLDGNTNSFRDEFLAVYYIVTKEFQVSNLGFSLIQPKVNRLYFI